MRIYLAVSSARPIPPGAADPRQPELVMPREAGPWRSFRWSARDRATLLLAWSNEPDDPRLVPPLAADEDAAVGCPGYLGGPGDVDRLLRAAGLGAAADDSPGVFGVFRADQSGFQAITTAVRLHPVYHAAAGELVLASNSALLLRDVGSITRYDLRALQSLVRIGYFLGDGTPFEGIEALPAHSTLEVRAGSRRIIRRGLPIAMDGVPRGPTRARLVREFVDGLTAAALPLRAFPEPISLSLTGGRDSRIIAAILHAARIPFRTSTSGFPDHPDVLLARQIAARLGVSHQSIPAARDESGAALLVPHPLARAWDVIRATDGMVSAHNNVIRPAPFELVPRISGAGGEQLRGGFLVNQPVLAAQAIRWRVRDLFLGRSRFFTEQANRWARADLAPWAERARRDPMGALDHLYLYYRSGRWSAAARAASAAGNPTFNLLFDNRLVRRALAMSAEWRRSERPFHEAIATLAPALRDLPLTGRRWRYEVVPLPWALRPGWRARAPLKADATSSGFDWRNQPDAPLKAIFREQILGGPPALFEIVDRAQVEALLTRRALKKAQTVFLWNAYTASALLSGVWLEARPARPDIRISLPARAADDGGAPVRRGEPGGDRSG